MASPSTTHSASTPALGDSLLNTPFYLRQALSAQQTRHLPEPQDSGILKDPISAEQLARLDKIHSKRAFHFNPVTFSPHVLIPALTPPAHPLANKPSCCRESPNPLPPPRITRHMHISRAALRPPSPTSRRRLHRRHPRPLRH